MEEIKTFSFFFPADIFQRQFIILRQNGRYILLTQRIVLRDVRHHRLHGDLLESQVRQMLHVFGKVQIVSGKSAPHIIIHLVSALGHLLILRYHLVIASLSAPVRPHQVMDSFSPVDAENDIRHLRVGKFQYLIAQKDAVGSQRKPELLVVRRFQAPAVSHQILHHLPVKQRFPAEEIHLQIDPVPRMRHQKVKRLPARLITHERPSAVVLSFLRKTVSAGQVTVVGDMQTKRLHHRLPAFIFTDILLINILCIQHARFF